MNYSTAIFLINKSARAVMCEYEPEGAPKLFKTLNQNIEEDDFVIVETDTRHSMTVVKVVETDVDFDFDTKDKIHWVVGVVDYNTHTKLLKQEAAAIKAIKSAELRKKRADIRENLLADHLDTIKALPISELNGDDKVVEAVIEDK